MKAFNLSKFTSFNIYLILQYLDQVIELPGWKNANTCNTIYTKKVNKQVYPKSTGKLEKRREICWNMQFFIKLRGKTLLAIFLIKKIASLTFERVIFQNTSKWRLSIFENSHISTYGTLIRRLNFLAEKMQTHAT